MASRYPPLPSPRRRSVLQARGGIIAALVLREMSARYGRSPGGYLWAILQPLGMVLMLSIGFSLLLRTPSLGNSFFLFYATGFIPFNTYQTTVAVSMNALKFSKALLVYPVVTWFDAVAGRLILNALTSYLVAFVIFFGTLMVIDSPGTLEFGKIVEAMLAGVLMAVGVGMVNACIMSFYPVWTNVWVIITRPLFLASGVIYIYEDLPQVAQDILWFNPLLHVTGLMRSGFFQGYDPNYVSSAYIWGVTLVSIAAGVLLLRRFHREILNQ